MINSRSRLRSSDNAQQSRQFHGHKLEVKTGPRSTGLLDLMPHSPTVPVTMVAVMTVPTMMAMPPSHFGRHRLGIFLHGGGSAGIAERQRTGPLGRSSQNKHCANGGKAQNFRHLHR
jgi:hypothetical protein